MQARGVMREDINEIKRGKCRRIATLFLPAATRREGAPHQLLPYMDSIPKIEQPLREGREWDLEFRISPGNHVIGHVIGHRPSPVLFDDSKRCQKGVRRVSEGSDESRILQ